MTDVTTDTDAQVEPTAPVGSTWRLLGVVRADASRAPDIDYVVHGSVAAALVTHDAGAPARELLREHVALIERVFDEGPILPARYGTLVADRATLVDVFLAPHEEELAAALDEVSGRAEVHVRIEQDEDGAVAEVIRRDPALRELAQSLLADDDTSPYSGRVRLGERIARAVAELTEADANAVVAMLSPLAVSVRGSAPGDSAVVLDASYLIDLDRYDEFDSKVGEVIETLAGRARVTALGPQAPYSFADLLGG